MASGTEKIFPALQAKGRNELDDLIICSVPDLASQEWPLNKML